MARLRAQDKIICRILTPIEIHLRGRGLKSTIHINNIYPFSKRCLDLPWSRLIGSELLAQGKILNYIIRVLRQNLDSQTLWLLSLFTKCPLLKSSRWPKPLSLGNLSKLLENLETRASLSFHNHETLNCRLKWPKISMTTYKVILFMQRLTEFCRRTMMTTTSL